MNDAKKPRWAEATLHIVLPARDRESVAGDLLEEYREAVLPEQGRFRARLWYWRQVLVLVDGVRFGVMLGIALGAWVLIDSAINPLAEDTPIVVGSMFASVFVLLGLPGFLARQRGSPLTDAIKASALAGVTTFALFHALSVLRVDLFLDTIQRRSDWQGLLLRYRQSGFESVRAYANYVYIRAGASRPGRGHRCGRHRGTVGRFGRRRDWRSGGACPEGWRMNQQTPSRMAVAVGCRFGLLLGGVQVINHSLEVFGNLQPPLPAIRGVMMWAILFLVCGAASSFAYGRTRAVPFGIIASIFAADCGAAILVVYAIAVGVARGEPLSSQAIVSAACIHLGGSVLIGFAIGLASGLTAAALGRGSRAMAMGAAVWPRARARGRTVSHRARYRA